VTVELKLIFGSETLDFAIKNAGMLAFVSLPTKKDGTKMMRFVLPSRISEAVHQRFSLRIRNIDGLVIGLDRCRRIKGRVFEGEYGPGSLFVDPMVVVELKI
jgi:hypothetical protein